MRKILSILLISALILASTGSVLAQGEKAVGEPGSGGAASPGAAAVPQRLSVSKNHFNIDYTPRADSEEVAIYLGNYDKYKIMRLTDPDRLVIDIPNTKYSNSPKKLDTSGIQVKAVRYAKFTSSISRIVLDLNGQSGYSVKEQKGKLQITVFAPGYKNMSYHNNGDRIYVLLKDAKLTEGDEHLKKLYAEKRDGTAGSYTVTFPSARADLGEGKLIINDGCLKSVEIKKDIAGNTTTITFLAYGRYSYMVFTRADGDTSITILKPAQKADRLVVIDPGHGGRMPGAIYKKLYEKELNLDIALRLNKLLLQNKVKTFMIRQDDSTVDNYERAYIANMLNASLYLSVHNNAMDDRSFSGTMTLYYPQSAWAVGFTGKTFAGIIQSRLVRKLGTVDRKTSARPNLVVLKATAMPAALAEIAFMTNSRDRSRLGDTAFRQKAAQALCDSVLDALKKLR